MSADHLRPAREVQALEEVGVTAISRGVAVWVALVFMVTIFGVALCEPFAEGLDGASDAAGISTSVHRQIFTEFGAQTRTALMRLGPGRALAANRSLMAAMDRFEDRLGEQSFLRRWLLPRLQWRLAASLGLGNEQVYVGREGWLFFRPDLDYVIGRGFLDSPVQEARRRSGDAWLPAPEPDPIPALVIFNNNSGLGRFTSSWCPFRSSRPWSPNGSVGEISDRGGPCKIHRSRSFSISSRIWDSTSSIRPRSWCRPGSSRAPINTCAPIPIGRPRRSRPRPERLP